MKQVVQSLNSPTCEIVDVPSPRLRSGHVLIRTIYSLISVGTERMLVDFGKSGLIGKALQQPDKVQQVLQKAQQDGLPSAFEAVHSKLQSYIPLGYSNVGEVIAVGDDVSAFQPGDRVVSNGSHSELVVVSQNLCALIPDNVDYQSAAFTVLASIGLQGIRLAQPTFGETFLVSGLGLIGLLTAQLLLAQGCNVLGLDPDPDKCKLAESLGVSTFTLTAGSDPVAWAMNQTSGVGVDGVLITAATSSSQPVHVAAQSSRQRGRIVLVGVTGLELRRDLFYKKELSFQVSCSYGPGRYDPAYEDSCHDYPIGFVRWTEQRNFQAVLRALSSGLIKTEPLISHRFHIDKAVDAYQLLSGPAPSLGIILKYPGSVDPQERTLELHSQDPTPAIRNSDSAHIRIGVIGAGNYASRIRSPLSLKLVLGSTPLLHPVALLLLIWVADSGFKGQYRCGFFVGRSEL